MHGITAIVMKDVPLQKTVLPAGIYSISSHTMDIIGNNLALAATGNSLSSVHDFIVKEENVFGQIFAVSTGSTVMEQDIGGGGVGSIDSQAVYLDILGGRGKAH